MSAGSGSTYRPAKEKIIAKPPTKNPRGMWSPPTINGSRGSWSPERSTTHWRPSIFSTRKWTRANAKNFTARAGPFFWANKVPPGRMGRPGGGGGRRGGHRGPMHAARNLFSYPRAAAAPAPFLPMTRAEMQALGWDACDVIIVTGDAYVDHPSFGMAIIGRLLEAQGFRVGIIAQPDWHSAEPFRELGAPNLFFGITAGNMDSMVNRYTADRRIRSDDAYTPDGAGGCRPDRSVIVYAQRCARGLSRRAGRHRRHRGVAAAHRALRLLVREGAPLGPDRCQGRPAGVRQRRARDRRDRPSPGGGEGIRDITDIRGTAFMRRGTPSGWIEIDSTHLDAPGPLDKPIDPYAWANRKEKKPVPLPADAEPGSPTVVRFARQVRNVDRERSVIRLPSHRSVQEDPVLYAHASRILHLESNPGNARALVQRHGDVDVWLNPPPIPLTTTEMDAVYELPYQRRPHPVYGKAKIPGLGDDPLLGDHPARLLRRLHLLLDHRARGPHHPEPLGGIGAARDRRRVRDTVPGFTGVISDLGGPTANMYRLACKSPQDRSGLPAPVVRLSGHLPEPQHRPCAADRAVPQGARAAGHQEGPDRLGRALRPGGESPEYVKELAQHHVGGYLKIAPERSPSGPAVQDDEARRRHLLTSSRSCSTSTRQRRARSST